MPDWYFHFLSPPYFCRKINHCISPHSCTDASLFRSKPLQRCPLTSEISHVASGMWLILRRLLQRQGWQDRPILPSPDALSFPGIPPPDLTWSHAPERKFNHVQGAYFRPQDNFPSKQKYTQAAFLNMRLEYHTHPIPQCAQCALGDEHTLGFAQLQISFIVKSDDVNSKITVESNASQRLNLYSWTEYVWWVLTTHMLHSVRCRYV